jgi:hypothetical protein
MRKLKLLAVAFLLSITTLFASENIDDTNTGIRDQIIQLLDNAQFESEKDFNVEFTFTFNSDGEIVVLNVNSSRKDVKDYIRNNVNYKKINSPGIKNEKYTLPIKVKTI